MAIAPHLLVTGGARGIGLALCQSALARGWRVSATLRAGPVPVGVTAYQIDLRDHAALPALASEVGPLDILINNAGVIGPKGDTLSPIDTAAFLEVIAINTLAPLAVTQALLPNLMAAPSGSGRVLSISSQMASMGYAKSNHIAYRASKVALNKVMQAMATDLFPKGIAAVAIDPGWVKTDMGGPEAELDPEQVAEGIVEIAATLTTAQSGSFLRHDGTPRDW
jgi:NAD(P)-dependent dehydrogenase (short-subunit alcohol dehydrogenase family)